MIETAVPDAFYQRSPERAVPDKQHVEILAHGMELFQRVHQHGQVLLLGVLPDVHENRGRR